MTPAIALDRDANYEAAEVALWLRVTRATFSRDQTRLRAQGFPVPIKRWGKRVWSGAALLDWRDRTPPAPDGGNVITFRRDKGLDPRAAAAHGARRSD